MDTLFCDTALAHRIERAETRLIVDAGRAAQSRSGTDGFAIPIAGGMASFAEPDSPFNKVVGLGELVAVNPGLVLGPGQHAHRTTSIEVIRKLLSREVPAVPHIGFSVVDVRDVAIAHRLAMETPEAAGNRYILAGEHLWMGDIAAVLAAEFGPRGYRVPTRRLPYWLMWMIARFDKAVGLALSLVGQQQLVTACKAVTELGWGTRPAHQSIMDSAESLLHYGVVGRSDAEARTPQLA